MGWQWHQLDYMQIICTSLQTDNHTSTSPLPFLQDGCPSCNQTNSIKALKASVHKKNPKALIWGYTDYFSTKLNKQLKICHIITCEWMSDKGTYCICDHEFCNHELCPTMVTFEPNLVMVKMNQDAKYLGQRSVTSKVIVCQTLDWLVYLGH